MNRKSIIHSMCMTFNHAYGLMPKEEQQTLFNRMAQIFDNDIKPNMDFKEEKNCKTCKYKNNKEFQYKCICCFRAPNHEEQDNWEAAE